MFFFSLSPHGPISAEGLPIRRRDLNAKKLSLPPSAGLCMPANEHDPNALALFRARHYLQDDQVPELKILDTAPEHLRNHVIVCVCGMADGNLYDLLASLRSRLEALQPVVLLCASMQEKVWRRLGVFSELYVVRGSGMRWADLLRAQAVRAAHILVLSVRPGAVEDPNSGKKR
jgi:hypothetical protein